MPFIEFSPTRFCPISILPQDAVSQSDFRRFTEPLRAARRNFQDLVTQVFTNTVLDNAARTKLLEEQTLTKFYAELGEFTALNPGDVNKVTGWAAQLFDYQFGVGGRIKYSFDEMAQVSFGMLNLVGRVGAVQRSNELNNLIAALLPDVPKYTKALIASETVEIGSIPRNLIAAGDTASAQVFNQQRVEQWRQWMSSYGLTPEQIGALSDAGLGVSTVFSEMAVTARAFGVDVNPITNIGYIARIFEPDGALKFDDVLSQDGLLNVNVAARNDLSTRHNISRQNNWLVAEDIPTLVEVLGLSQGRLFSNMAVDGFYKPNGFSYAEAMAGNKPAFLVMPDNANILKFDTKKDARKGLYDYIESNVTFPGGKQGVPYLEFQARYSDPDPVEFIKYARTVLPQYDGIIISVYDNANVLIEDNLMDVTGKIRPYDMTQEVLPLISDPVKFHEYVRTKLTGSQIDDLQALGVLNKLPMSNREVALYYATKYNWTGWDPHMLINLDIEDVLKRYKESLNHAVKTSAFIKGIISDPAATAGWALRRDSTEYLSRKEYYDANWVPLTKDAGEILQSIGLSGDEVAELTATLVHPNVAAQFRASLHLATDPTTQGIFAHTLQRVGRVGNRSILSADPIGYFMRNTAVTASWAWANGMNMLRWGPARDDIFRAFKDGLDSFDNTKEFGVMDGKTVTMREAFEKFMMHQAGEVAAATANTVVGYKTGNVWDFFVNNTAGIPRAYWQIFNYATARNASVGFKNIGFSERIMRFLKASGLKFESFTSNFFSPIAALTNMEELAIKWATFQTFVRKPGVEWGQVFTSATHKQYGTWEELYRAMDDVFIRPDTAGVFTQYGTTWYQPFMQYQMKMPLLVMKWMVRNPAKFVAYLRWRDLNQEVENKRHSPVKAGFQDWELDGRPYMLGSEVDSQTGELKFYTLMANSWEPISATLEMFSGVANTAQRMFFQQPAGQQGDIRASARHEDAQTFIRGLVAGKYPWITLPYELYTGKDAFTGRQFTDSPFENRVNVVGLSMPWQWAAVAKKFPLVDRLDRMNPYGAWGEAPLKDVRGNLVVDVNGRPVRPGKLSIWNTERVQRDAKLNDISGRNIVYQVLRAAGFNVRVVEYDRNLQSNEQDIQKTITVMVDEMDKYRDNFKNQFTDGRPLSQERLAREKEVFKNQLILYGQLLLDQKRLQRYMRTRDVPTMTDLRERRGLEADAKFTLEGIPMPGDAEMNSIASQLLEENKKNLQVIEDIANGVNNGKEKEKR